MLKVIFFSFLSITAMAAEPTPAQKAGEPVIERGHMDKPGSKALIAAEVKQDCLVKPMGAANHAEICMEGNKKYCPKGYTLKQKPHACPPGKMCVQVMQDYCEKGVAK